MKSYSDNSTMPMVNDTISIMKENSAMRDRTLFLSEEVDRDSIFKIIYYMNRLRRLDEKDCIPMKARDPITIIIDSYGGYVNHGLALMSTIFSFRDMGYDIITQVNSVAMSMGFMILLCGSKRHALRYASIMCHQPSSATWGTLQNQEEDIEETKRMWDTMKTVIVENTNITIEQLDDIKNRKFDWYMNPKEALELGVIDKII